MRENNSKDPVADLDMSSFIRYRRLQMPKMGKSPVKKEPRTNIFDRIVPKRNEAILGQNSSILEQRKTVGLNVSQSPEPTISAIRGVHTPVEHGIQGAMGDLGIGSNLNRIPHRDRGDRASLTSSLSSLEDHSTSSISSSGSERNGIGLRRGVRVGDSRLIESRLRGGHRIKSGRRIESVEDEGDGHSTGEEGSDSAMDPGSSSTDEGEKTADDHSDRLSETISRLSISSDDSSFALHKTKEKSDQSIQLNTPKNFRKVLFVCNL